MYNIYDGLIEELYNTDGDFITSQNVNEYVKGVIDAYEKEITTTGGADFIEVRLTFDWDSLEPTEPFDELQFFK